MQIHQGRRVPHRYVAATVVSILCIVLLGCGSHSHYTRPSPEAICPAPILSVFPRKVSVGAEVELRGAYWSACVDSFTNGSADETTPRLGLNVTIRIFQGNASYALAKLTADSDGSFKSTAVLPPTIGSGAATIRGSFGTGVSPPRFEDTASSTGRSAMQA